MILTEAEAEAGMEAIKSLGAHADMLCMSSLTCTSFLGVATLYPIPIFYSCIMFPLLPAYSSQPIAGYFRVCKYDMSSYATSRVWVRVCNPTYPSDQVRDGNMKAENCKKKGSIRAV